MSLVMLATAASAFFQPSWLCAAGLPVAELKRDTAVDFEKEVLPILKKHCIACHNSASAENHLVLETPQTIAKGGDSGAAVEPKKADDSYLFQVAAHTSDPIMPPKDNKVNAKPLNPQELAILKLWINQGATGTVSSSASQVVFQSLPPGVNPIYAVAVTPDGQFAACGRANQIFVYQVLTGQLVSRLTDPALVKSSPYNKPGVAHLDLVQSLTFSPDGQLLASGGYKEVKLWRRPQNTQHGKLPPVSGEVTALALSADHKRLAVAGSDQKIVLIDLEAGKVQHELTGHGGAVSGLQFSPDGSRLYSGSADKSIRIWNTADGKQLVQTDTPAAVTALILLGDGTKLASGGGDNTIRLWTVAGDPPALTEGKPCTGHSQPITSLAVIPSTPTQFISGSADGTVRQWNADNSTSNRTMQHGAPVTSVAVRPDGQKFASVGGPVGKLWNAQNGQAAGDIKGDYRLQTVLAKTTAALDTAKQNVAARKTELANAEKDAPTKADALKKATEALAAADKTFNEKNDAYKKATEAKTAAEKAASEAATTVENAKKTAEAAKAAADKDNKNADLAAAKTAADKALTEAMAKSKTASDELTKQTKAATDAEKPFKDAEGARVAAQKVQEDAAKASKLATELIPTSKSAVEAAEALQKKLEGDLETAKKNATDAEKPIRAVAFAPDNLQLATSGDDSAVHTWNSNDGAPVEIFEGHTGAGSALAFVSDRYLISGALDKKAIQWDLAADWTLERTIGGMDTNAFVDRVISLDFSPDGKLLATGGGEPSRSGEVKLWNVADGTLFKEIPEAHSDTVFGLDFSADGKMLATCAADKFVKAFDVASGKFIRSFEGHTHHVLGVSWQTNGKSLVSCGADNVVKVWTFETGEQQRTIQGFNKQVTSISMVGDSTNAITSAGDKGVRLHRIDNGQSVRSFSGGTDFMQSAAATPNGKLIVGGGQDSVLWIWNGDNGQTIRSLPAPDAAANQQASK